MPTFLSYNNFQLMKGIVATVCAMAIATNAQFNFEVNNGFRFGILGSEVINIGGNNKEKPFNTGSWPVDAAKLIPPMPQISPFKVPNMGNPFIPPPPPQGPTPMPAPASPMNNGIISSLEMKQASQMKAPEVKIEPNQLIQPNPMQNRQLPSSKQADAQQLIRKTVQTVIQPKISEKKEKQQEIEIKPVVRPNIRGFEPIKEVNAPNFTQNKGMIKTTLDISGQRKKEEQEIEELKRIQDQRLSQFVKLMPESQKQHLRAIAASKTQS